MHENTEEKKPAEKKRFRVSSLRVLAEVLIIGVFCVGLFLQTGTGTLSATGIWEVFALCPLGALTAFIASKTLIPQQVVGVIVFVAFVLVLGRAFCAWACPTQLWYKLANRTDAGERKRGRKHAGAGGKAADGAGADGKLASDTASASGSETAELGAMANETADGIAPAKRRLLGAPSPRLRGGIHDSRSWVLIAAIASALVVGFPVFCLICPIGLTFASIISLWNFLNFNTFGPGVIIFPLILVVELFVLRKWCHTLCPVGALLSLIARGNKTFVPTVDAHTCLHTTEHTACHRCAEACPEEIDLHRTEASAPMHQCTKCHLCAEACPVSAITFPLIAHGKRGVEEARAHAETDAASTPVENEESAR